MNHRTLAVAVAVVMCTVIPQAGGAVPRTFEPGSLVIPMDLAYQDSGMLQAYGLVFQLLRQGVRVYWAIEPTKTWHAAPCDTAGDECAWDCAIEGSGVKCPYPTGSPDFTASTTVVWDAAGTLEPGAAISGHAYRGGPFVVDAADHDRALAVVNAWNDESLWAANPWAERTVFQVVSVHEATAAFTAPVRKEMVAAPTIAVFADGNEDIATSYLRAAGIPQSNGDEFPTGRCAADTCGAGTANPDMLTVPSVAGDMGTCDAPSTDHRNGQLFADGVPAYCQIMSMHWGVADRETVECNGGRCPGTAAECAGDPITYHGHEVVAEVRAFLDFPVHFFAECQAVNAYENTIPNPAWPFLDDDDRMGHFLTTVGIPVDCLPGGGCASGDYECIAGGCDGGTRDCCQPRDVRERGAGFFIAAQPDSADIRVLHPEVPYNQLDGAFETTGGSEPAYDLAAEMGAAYVNDRNVTFITGPDGPGVQDLWMTGYKDGECDIILYKPGLKADDCTKGKVSYLGGHSYDTNVPLSANPSSQGTRLFLNALFEADCVTTEGQPNLAVTLSGPATVPVAAPRGSYVVGYANSGVGTALDGVLTLELPAGVTVDDAGGGTVTGSTVTFAVGSIGATGTLLPPPAAGSWTVALSFAGEGVYTLAARLGYVVGVTALTAGPAILDVGVGVEPPPRDGGTDGDGGGGDGSGDGGAGDGGGGNGDGGGCGCRVGDRSNPFLLFAALGAIALLRRRRR
jgi:MYXO-CTERM domain-containing protein